MSKTGPNGRDKPVKAVPAKALSRLASKFGAVLQKRKQEQPPASNAWSNLIRDALQLQRGKIPLLLAVEAGNQSMCRELLGAQTAEQLKVRRKYLVKHI